jgi:hypothetical protein
MHRLSRKFQLIPTSRHLRLCEYIPRNQKGRLAALPGLRTAKMQTGGGWLKTALAPGRKNPQPMLDVGQEFRQAF